MTDITEKEFLFKETKYTAKTKIVVMSIAVKIAVSEKDLADQKMPSLKALADNLELEYNNGDLPLSYLEENFEVTDLTMTRITYHERS